MASAREIVSKFMSSDPAYYAGLGNRPDLLNSRTLDDINAALYVQVGNDASVEFVKMVRDLSERGDVSPATFLNTLYNLEADGWKHNGEVENTTARLAADAARNGGNPLVFGMLALGEAVHGYQHGASSVAGDFLRDHKFVGRDLTSKIREIPEDAGPLLRSFIQRENARLEAPSQRSIG